MRTHLVSSLASMLVVVTATACVPADDAAPEPPGDPGGGKADDFAVVVPIGSDATTGIDWLRPGFTLFQAPTSVAGEVSFAVGSAAVHVWSWSGSWDYVGKLSSEVRSIATDGPTYLAATPVAASATVAVRFASRERFATVVVDTPAELAALGLEAVDARSRDLLGWLGSPALLEAHTIRLTLLPVESRPTASAIVTASGDLVRAVALTVRSEPGVDGVACTSVHVLDDVAFGQAAPDTSRPGVCGHIATIHSLLRLGVWKPADTFDGDHIRKEIVERIDGYRDDHASGTSLREIADAHKFEIKAATGKLVGCELRSADPGDKARLQVFAKNLAARVNPPAKDWDCTLGVWGKPTFAHVEHVTSVDYDEASGGAKINTLNGFAQGNSNATVPKAPGKNTWYTTPDAPAGQPSCGLESTAEEGDPFDGVTTTALYSICCRLPA